MVLNGGLSSACVTAPATGASWRSSRLARRGSSAVNDVTRSSSAGPFGCRWSVPCSPVYGPAFPAPARSVRCRAAVVNRLTHHRLPAPPGPQGQSPPPSPHALSQATADRALRRRPQPGSLVGAAVGPPRTVFVLPRTCPPLPGRPSEPATLNLPMTIRRPLAPVGFPDRTSRGVFSRRVTIRPLGANAGVLHIADVSQAECRVGHLSPCAFHGINR